MELSNLDYYSGSGSGPDTGDTYRIRGTYTPVSGIVTGTGIPLILSFLYLSHYVLWEVVIFREMYRTIGHDHRSEK